MDSSHIQDLTSKSRHEVHTHPNNTSVEAIPHRTRPKYILHKASLQNVTKPNTKSVTREGEEKEPIMNAYGLGNVEVHSVCMEPEEANVISIHAYVAHLVTCLSLRVLLELEIRELSISLNAADLTCNNRIMET